MIHEPKGSMCTNCMDSYEDCSGLDFSKMPVHKGYKNITFVICKAYEDKDSHAVTKRINQ